MTAPALVECPKCHRRFRSVGSVGFCDDCGVYTDWTPPDAAAAHPKRKPDGRTEEEVQAAVTRAWELHGWTVCDMSQSRPTQQREGFSDLVCLSKRGRGVVFCEVKSATGRQSEAQKTFERDCVAAGATYMIARHEDDVSRYVAGLDGEVAS